MATTAIWPIRGRLDQVITYTENPDKTANPKWEQADLQALSDVVEYAMDEAKTRGVVNELEHIADEGQCQRQYFTSGVNCDPSTARDAMNMTKRRFGKEGGIVAFHGYQSFLPGEVTPEQAHLIGLELAQRLWGERFEVVVSTHLNTGVVHNHFVLNSVSCMDGLRYCDNKKTYAQMRRVSDELCREHMLSVITQQNGRSAHYREWMADHAGERTWRTAIREDVDKAAAASMTWQAFLAQMRKQGYEVKTGVKHIAVRPPGKERFVRLRSLGDEYAEDALRQRNFLIPYVALCRYRHPCHKFSTTFYCRAFNQKPTGGNHFSLKGVAPMRIIQLEQATKRFNENIVLNNITVSFKQGLIHGIIGRNGSGKTMLLKVICGFVPLTSGKIFVNNVQLGKGIIIETPGFLPNYSAFQNLKLLAKIKNKVSIDRIQEVMCLVGLDPDNKKHVSKLSMGMRQRLGIAQAIMENPSLLILDEPFNGLDANGIEDMRNLLLDQKERGKTILMASHSSEDIKCLCDNVIRMEQGRIT